MFSFVQQARYRDEPPSKSEDQFTWVMWDIIIDAAFVVQKTRWVELIRLRKVTRIAHHLPIS